MYTETTTLRRQQNPRCIPFDLPPLLSSLPFLPSSLFSSIYIYSTVATTSCAQSAITGGGWLHTRSTLVEFLYTVVGFSRSNFYYYIPILDIYNNSASVCMTSYYLELNTLFALYRKSEGRRAFWRKNVELHIRPRPPTRRSLIFYLLSTRWDLVNLHRQGLIDTFNFHRGPRDAKRCCAWIGRFYSCRR